VLTGTCSSQIAIPAAPLAECTTGFTQATFRHRTRKRLQHAGQGPAPFAGASGAPRPLSTPHPRPPSLRPAVRPRPGCGALCAFFSLVCSPKSGALRYNARAIQLVLFGRRVYPIAVPRSGQQPCTAAVNFWPPQAVIVAETPMGCNIQANDGAASPDHPSRLVGTVQRLFSRRAARTCARRSRRREQSPVPESV